MKKNTRLVRTPSNWQDMSGRESITKKINSYLACYFVGNENVMADECLYEALKCMSLADKPHARSLISEYLNDQFYGGQKSVLLNRLEYCYEPAEQIIQMIKTSEQD